MLVFVYDCSDGGLVVVLVEFCIVFDLGISVILFIGLVCLEWVLFVEGGSCVIVLVNVVFFFVWE